VHGVCFASCDFVLRCVQLQCGCEVLCLFSRWARYLFQCFVFVAKPCAADCFVCDSRTVREI
jgi:hypothetical protein